ncbi:hypothetical protein PIB30_005205 [Stylosanthes scabra]|uniref:C2H2-type domain-containing protein n=1 Tax=Stylosanthes scabra TaxID=79078 RepID=A0ABU6S3C9_9FABA|nr:hypothetical protein [Stylosanthes scabra]
MGTDEEWYQRDKHDARQTKYLRFNAVNLEEQFGGGVEKGASRGYTCISRRQLYDNDQGGRNIVWCCLYLCMNCHLTATTSFLHGSTHDRLSNLSSKLQFVGRHSWARTTVHFIS